MENLQEQPTPALVIHRYGKKQYCVLPEGIDPESDEAKGKHLLISSRKACEAFVQERLALAAAQAAAAPAQNGHAPPEDPESYAAKVRQAYRSLADERQSPDVSIAELYQRVGGELERFHTFLQAEAYENRVAPSVGEPTLAGEEAKRSALTLPGEVDRITWQPLRFLNVKLMEAPAPEVKAAVAVTPEAPDEPPVRFNVAFTRAEIDLLREALDDQCRAIAARADASQVTRLQAFTDISTRLDGLHPQKQGVQAEVQHEVEVKPSAVPREPELAEHESYRKELVERARKAYPNASPELAAKLDKEINRRVEMVRTYQGHLEKVAADSFPTATPEEKAARQQNICNEVHSYRIVLEKHIAEKREQRQQEQHQAPPPAARARQQQRGYGMER